MNISKARNAIYYYLKPLLPRRFQIWLRSEVILRKRRTCSNVWPILESAGKPPKGWAGWPDQKRFALVLTHDLETARGQEKCQDLLEIEKELGFRSSFYIVPERYPVSRELLYHINKQGFEVGVHGLHHDGKLYKSQSIFRKRATRINHYLKEWNATGFRSPAMHHNLHWLHDLNIHYDASTFDTDPFEPQSDAAGTIFPFCVKEDHTDRAYIELPYTLPQDFTLFILMKERDINIWKEKLDWIVQHGGMALLNSHPDYMNFNRKRLTNEGYSAEYYIWFLKYIKSKYNSLYWHVLPKEMATFWVSKIVDK